MGLANLALYRIAAWPRRKALLFTNNDDSLVGMRLNITLRASFDDGATYVTTYPTECICYSCSYTSIAFCLIVVAALTYLLCVAAVVMRATRRQTHGLDRLAGLITAGLQSFHSASACLRCPTRQIIWRDLVAIQI